MDHMFHSSWPKLTVGRMFAAAARTLNILSSSQIASDIDLRNLNKSWHNICLFNQDPWLVYMLDDACDSTYLELIEGLMTRPATQRDHPRLHFNIAPWSKDQWWYDSPLME